MLCSLEIALLTDSLLGVIYCTNIVYLTYMYTTVN